MTDDQERQAAAEIEQSHPHWVVMWGCYSRLFWAFPHFQAPRGTIVSAPSGERLVVGMHDLEAEMRPGNLRVPAYDAPQRAAQLPRRLSREEVERRTFATAAAQTGSPAAASAPERQGVPVPARYPPGTPSSVQWAAAPTPAWVPRPQDQPLALGCDPYAVDPYRPDPYGSDPYGSDSHESDKYESDPGEFWQGLRTT